MVAFLLEGKGAVELGILCYHKELCIVLSGGRSKLSVWLLGGAWRKGVQEGRGQCLGLAVREAWLHASECPQGHSPPPPCGAQEPRFPDGLPRKLVGGVCHVMPWHK